MGKFDKRSVLRRKFDHVLNPMEDVSALMRGFANSIARNVNKIYVAFAGDIEGRKHD